MTKEKIARINELAHKSKTTGLTEAEKAEQSKFRADLSGVLWFLFYRILFMHGNSPLSDIFISFRDKYITFKENCQFFLFS